MDLRGRAAVRAIAFSLVGLLPGSALIRRGDCLDRLRLIVGTNRPHPERTAHSCVAYDMRVLLHSLADHMPSVARALEVFAS